MGTHVYGLPGAAQSRNARTRHQYADGQKDGLPTKQETSAVSGDRVSRASYLGGSDAGAIFGLNKYRPRSWVVRQKALGRLGEWGDRDLSDNPHIQRGNQMEPLIDQWVRDNIDPTVGHPSIYDELNEPGDPAPEAGQIFLLDEELGVGGHPDGVGEWILHEYKATTTRSLERVHKQGAKRKHLLQVHHYLWLTGREVGMLHYWNYNNWKPLTFRVKRRPNLYETLREEYEKVWTEVEEAARGVKGGEDVKLVGSGRLAERARQAAGGLGPMGGSGDAEGVEELAREYEEVKGIYYDAKDRKKELKSKLLTELDGREEVVTPNLTVTAEERHNGYASYKVVKVSES